MATANSGPGKTRRVKGEQTRTQILDATLVVIAESGLRGVTHRAVAKQAGVQPSLTTYYFKDIQDLIEQAFNSFCEQARPGYDAFWSDIERYLEQFSASDLRRLAVREEICARLANIAADYIESQVVYKPVGLAVEQVLFTQLRLAPSLRATAMSHRQTLLQPLVRLCRRFNTTDPEIDAELLLDTITRLEYQSLWTSEADLDRARTIRLVSRQLGWAMGLKRS